MAEKNQDTPIHYKEIPLNGRLRTAVDPSELFSANGVVDFQTMKNLRYADGHPQGVGGMTKINTTVLGNPQIKAVKQWRKDGPAEAHVLVSARDSNGLNQKVYKNSTAAPTAGDFTASAIFTDTSGYGSPWFSSAPTEKLVYCNGKDTAIWGGSEMKPVKFLDYDPNGSYKYDWTPQVRNALTDSENLATLHRYSSGGAADANTMLLLHCDGADDGTTFTDSSPTTPHTVTANGNAVTKTGQKKFGTASGYFDGTGDYLTIPDNADFDFSSGNFTFDCWMYLTSSTATARTIYWHGTDADNYFRIYTAPLAASNTAIFVEVKAAASTVVSFSGWASSYLNTWGHLAVSESGNDWRIFWNGTQIGYSSDTDRCANYTGSVYIGANASGTEGFIGYLDEIRVSNTARWTSSFSPPPQAYSSATVITDLLIASQLPLQGVKFYVGTANASAATMTGYEWDGSNWSAVTITDNTSSGGKSLAQTGTVTFSSTASTSKQKLYDDILAYWYLFEITNCDTTTTISQITCDAPMQSLKELWDGTFRTIGSFLVYKNSTFNDYTMAVFQDSWTSADTSSYVELDSLATATDSFICGFTEQMTALRCHLIGGHVNTTAGTAVTIYYANGVTPPTDSTAWTAVGAVVDGTMQNNVSFAQSGTLSWNAPAITSEHPISLSGPPRTTTTITATSGFSIDLSALKGGQLPIIKSREIVSTSTTGGGQAVNKTPLHYYKVVFSQNLSADVQLFYVGGIPASQTVSGHKVAVHHVDRLWLWGDEKDPLMGRCTARDTAQVLRGDDTGFLYLKNAPTAGVSLFERYGSTATNVQVVCEATRTWAIIGETIENFQPNCIDESKGCTAPLTMDAATVEILPGVFRRVAMWQAQDSIVMCDGSTVIEVSGDIRDKFDPKHANYLTAATLATCTGWIDQIYNEYHWVIPGSTEWVYDILRKKWSETPRATAKRLSCGTAVFDTNGAPYSYGATTAGYLYRLEYGTTMDGTGIPFTLKTADIAPTGRITDRTECCSVRLIGIAKSTTTQTIAVAHYGDSSSTASTPTIPGISMTNSGKRLFNVYRSFGIQPKNHVFHSFEFTITTTDETIGFEPLFLVIGYKIIGKDTR